MSPKSKKRLIVISLISFSISLLKKKHKNSKQKRAEKSIQKISEAFDKKLEDIPIMESVNVRIKS